MMSNFPMNVTKKINMIVVAQVTPLQPIKSCFCNCLVCHGCDGSKRHKHEDKLAAVTILRESWDWSLLPIIIVLTFTFRTVLVCVPPPGCDGQRISPEYWNNLTCCLASRPDLTHSALNTSTTCLPRSSSTSRPQPEISSTTAKMELILVSHDCFATISRIIIFFWQNISIYIFFKNLNWDVIN